MNKEEASRKNQEGVKLLEQEKYEEALIKFNEAIEIDEENAAAWLNRSEANKKLGKEAEANADRERWESLRKVTSEEPIQSREGEVSRHREAEVPLPS